MSDMALKEPLEQGKEVPTKSIWHNLKIARDSKAKEDAELLDAVAKRDFLIEDEIFRRVYGIDCAEHLARFRANKTLPDVVRRFCREFLEKKVSHFDDASRPYIRVLRK